MSYLSKSLASALLATLLIGCGSSSSESTQTSLISGVAVDDLIIDGDVVVYPVGKPGTILKRGKTSHNEGFYELDINYDGVVVVKVTCGAEGQMRSPNGTISRCEDDLELHSAAAVSPETSTVKVNISPLTDLMVSQMQENGGTKVALESAQENIGEMFGFDPISASPVTNVLYSGTVEAIRTLADDKNITMVNVIAQINEDLKDGEAGDDGTIASELAKVLNAGEVKNTFAENDGVVTPDTTTPVKSDIEVSKEFFAELRTQAMSVVDYDETGTDGFLDSEAKELGDALEDVALNVNVVGEYSVGVIGDIVEAIDNNETTRTTTVEEEGATVERVSTVTKMTDFVWSYSITEDGTAAYMGTVTLPSTELDDITPENFTTLLAKFEGTLPLREIDSDQAAGSQDLTMEVVVTKTMTGADLEVKELTVKYGDKEEISLSNFKGTTSYSYDDSKEDDKLTMEFIQFDEGTIRGKIDGYQLDGMLNVPEYVTNSSINGHGFERETFTTYMHGQLACFDGNQTRMMNTGVVTYIDANGSGHDINISENGYFRAIFDGNIGNMDKYSSRTENNGGSNYAPLPDDLEIDSTTCQLPSIVYFSMYIEDDSNFYNSGKLPKKVTFTGSIKNTTTNGEINGALSVDWLNATTMDLTEDSEDTPLVNVRLSGTLKMPSRPEMILNIGYTNPNNRNNITFGYAYDATTLNGTGAFDKDMENGLITLTTHNGIQSLIKISAGEVVYGSESPVTRNGRAVGELQEREGVPVILYTDGTFESLP